MAVITISREPGAFGEEIAARLAGSLGFLLVGKAYLSKLYKEMDHREAKAADMKGDEHEQGGSASDSQAYTRLVSDVVIPLAKAHDMVWLGGGGQALFRHCPGVLHVRIVASRQFRTVQLQIHEGLSAIDARRRIRELEVRRSKALRLGYGLKWEDPSLYDITLRMDRLSLEQAVKLVATAVDAMQLVQVPKEQIVESLLPQAERRERHERFVNAAEEEFARFLEFYCIPYQYEPRTFPLKTDAHGNIVEAFTPDFYLPEQDLYIELTTMKQSLVTRKNRKVRRLRALYPEVNIRIFYQRDFYSLLAKYGLLASKVANRLGSD